MTLDADPGPVAQDKEIIINPSADDMRRK